MIREKIIVLSICAGLILFGLFIFREMGNVGPEWNKNGLNVDEARKEARKCRKEGKIARLTYHGKTFDLECHSIKTPH